MCCGTIHPPGDSELLYSIGQSHDANHDVQVEGDPNLKGGVVPDVRVPLTWETVHAVNEAPSPQAHPDTSPNAREGLKTPSGSAGMNIRE
jgi:hypothetical protein